MNKTNHNVELSVIIPAYNEASRIEYTLKNIQAYFAEKLLSYEVIVVDDGSTDGTVEIVRDFDQNWRELRILENKENRGKGFSVNHGMHAAAGQYRLFMDADNSVDISHVDLFIEEMKKGADIVIGSIRLKDSDVSENAGWHRRTLGYCAKLLIRFFAVPGIRDTQRGFKLFSQKAAEAVFPLQTIHRFGFDIELLVIAWINGLTIKEMPVVWNNPDGSKVTLGSYFQTLGELAYIIRNRIGGRYTLTSSEKVNV